MENPSKGGFLVGRLVWLRRRRRKRESKVLVLCGGQTVSGDDRRVAVGEGPPSGNRKRGNPHFKEKEWWVADGCLESPPLNQTPLRILFSPGWGVCGKGQKFALSRFPPLLSFGKLFFSKVGASGVL